eukprot:1751879-Prymnesium_polylepis.1
MRGSRTSLFFSIPPHATFRHASSGECRPSQRAATGPSSPPSPTCSTPLRATQSELARAGESA